MFLDLQLSKEDFYSVYNWLYEVRNRWPDIGLALEMNYTDIHAIECDHKNDCKAALRDMLYKLFDSKKPLTWNKICSALRQPTVGQACLAEEIEKEQLLINASLSNKQATADDHELTRKEKDHHERAQRRKKYVIRRKREQRISPQRMETLLLIHCVAIILHCMNVK